MKKLIVLLVVAMFSIGANASMKCTNTPSGFCCWDPTVEGPWKPVTCD